MADSNGTIRTEGSGFPLAGVTVLALEQMQALPFATLLLARLGADIIKVESPGRGDSGRASLPKAKLANGEEVGPTYLRYNLGKRSIAIDFRTEAGRDLVRELAAKVDVVAENLGPGRADRYGVGWDDLRQVNPALVYLSISGFGSSGESPYANRPAYAGVAEAMSGIYEYSRRPNQPPIINPVGGLGDTGTGMFGVIGILAALRHRDRTGEGQHVDISMFDSMVSICDIPVNYWSVGVRREPDQPMRGPHILDGFRCKDGWLMLQVGRRHQFERLANMLGHPEWLEDERFSTPWGWSDHLEDVIRPAIEQWAASYGKQEAAEKFAEAGITAAPCNSAEDVVADPHVALRKMIVQIPRADDVEQPVLVAGNPVKMSLLPEREESALPALGEDTDDVLTELLGIDADRLATLRESGVVGN